MVAALDKSPAGLNDFSVLIALPLIIAACQRDGNIRPAGFLKTQIQSKPSRMGVPTVGA